MNQSYKTLLDVQIGTKAKVDGVEDQHDLINLSLSVVTARLASVLSILTKFSIEKSRKYKTDNMLKELGAALEHTFILCNACDFDIPTDEELSEFEEVVPYEVRHDALLTISGMINAVTDLYHLFYVEADSPPWENDLVREDLAEIICTIIVGMKHLGEKFGFTPDDVVCQFS